MRTVRVAFGSVVALSLAACASSGPSSTGTSPPSGATSEAGSTSTSAPPTTSSAPATTSSATTSGATTAEPGDKLTGPYVLVFKQSGGIAGLRMETTIDSAAKTITYGGMRNQTPETRALSAEDVASIATLIRAAGLAALDGKLKGAAPADAFAYELTVKMGGASHVLSWTDGAKVPPAVSDLQVGLAKLRDQKFPPGAPRGAATM